MGLDELLVLNALLRVLIRPNGEDECAGGGGGGLLEPLCSIVPDGPVLHNPPVDVHKSSANRLDCVVC